jgi:CheY-like chemotaxis protein
MSDIAGTPSLTEQIAPHLPYLRRYARALSGTQDSGDAHVAALLEAIIADRSMIDRSLPPRVALYMAFHRLWETAGGADQAQPPDDMREAIAQDRLEHMPPNARYALLLTAVEGFSNAEAETIVGVEAGGVAGLIDVAVRELRRQTQARVLIIEDEPIIAMDIEATVRELGHEVVGIADTRDRAVAHAKATSPDMVLADIQLADKSSGIDAVQDILRDISAPVIFITAYPERLLTGTRPEPTFLIAKPFRPETLQAAVSQALFFRETAFVA